MVSKLKIAKQNPNQYLFSGNQVITGFKNIIIRPKILLLAYACIGTSEPRQSERIILSTTKVQAEYCYRTEQTAHTTHGL